jgi:hypothetical protein
MPGAGFCWLPTLLGIVLTTTTSSAAPPPFYRIRATTLNDAGYQHGVLAKTQIQKWFQSDEVGLRCGGGDGWWDDVRSRGKGWWCEDVRLLVGMV